jgi:hypothetical protein
VRVFAALIDDGGVTGGDGIHRLDTDGNDRLSAPGRDVNYELTAKGSERLARLGVALPPARRGSIPLRYCVDWTEQRHHLAGGLGRGLLDRLLELDWVRPSRGTRAVEITSSGTQGLRTTFRITPDQPARP